MRRRHAIFLWDEMMSGNLFRRLARFLRSEQRAYSLLDPHFVARDTKQLRGALNLRHIPSLRYRRPGRHGYAEWAHSIGIFQTLMHQQLEGRANCSILDVGCGAGLLGIASEPFLGAQGRYQGLDVSTSSIEYCRSHYPPGHYHFHHLNVDNAVYASGQSKARKPWPLESDSCDLMTALSVWTHLEEQDAIFYFEEIGRVLKPGSSAMITFFVLDDLYRQNLDGAGQPRPAHVQDSRWAFERPAYDSEDWYYANWATVPEEAIGVNAAAIEALCSASGLVLESHYPGNWKADTGLFYQDILIFRKP